MKPIDPHFANRLINSSPVMILSCRQDARINMMAVSWVTWLSCNPPLLGVSIAPSCFSHDIIRKTGDFVLNIPDNSLIPLVHQVGTTTGRRVDKMRVFDIATYWGRTVKALTLSYAIGSLECELRRFEKFGDHTFFIAEVLFAAVEEEIWDDHWTEEAGLVFYLGGDKYLSDGKIIRPKVTTAYRSLREAQLKRQRESEDLFNNPKR